MGSRLTKAGVRAAIVVLCGALGSVLWGVVCDRAGKRHPRGHVISMGVLCLISTAFLGAAFGLPLLGVQLSNQEQFGLLALGGFFATCTAGPPGAIVMNVIHPKPKCKHLPTSPSIRSLPSWRCWRAYRVLPFIG